MKRLIKMINAVYVENRFIVNDEGLTKTDCCQKWICDDTHVYKLGSYLANSCYREHGNI